MSSHSDQYPRKSKKSVSAQASCHTYRSSPPSAAYRSTARRFACSAVNQASAPSFPVNSSTDTPARGSSGSTSRCGASSREAPCAVCR